MRIALDLLGGDGAPQTVADAAVLIPEELQVDLIVVGPRDLAEDIVARNGSRPSITYAGAPRGVSMSDDPLSVVRADRELSIRVACDLVKAGRADAVVSAGHTGATVAASLFTLGRLAGATRPALAVVLPALSGPVLLLDVGAATSATADLLAQFAMIGSAYSAALGVENPRVGLLTIGEEAGKGDELRRTADEFLARLPINYAGRVEGHDVATGTRADVIVTDGFTGNVVLKALEGAVVWSAERLGAAYTDRGPAREAARAVGLGDFAGGLLLGVDGVVVVGHGSSSPESIVACARLAERAVRHGIVERSAERLGELVVMRRAAAGYPAAASSSATGGAA